LLAQFLVVVDVSIVALPAIQRGLHFPAAGLQWVISGYALAFGGFLLLGGRSADGFRPVRDAGEIATGTDSVRASLSAQHSRPLRMIR
jgi:MFS family permease